jgi:hypothetical protein
MGTAVFGVFVAALLASYYLMVWGAGKLRPPVAGTCGIALAAGKNAADSIDNCRRKAEDGDVDALIMVADFDFQNILRGHEEKDAAALRMFRQAAQELEEMAENGEVRAQYKLGYLYAFSPLQNGRQAAKWFCAAAKQGSVQAADMLGELAKGHLHNTLHEGDNAYDNDEARKWDCRPEAGLPAIPAIDIGAASGLCPYKKDMDHNSCFW